ncbi:MAG: hypothetical protein E7680_05515 [Ruminococcaceae bacterium]|nr:hypothetical protein [Oscillospiraceae bacterium]
MPYCSNCRTFIPDGMATCPNCGNQYARAAQGQNNNANSNSQQQTASHSVTPSFWSRIRHLFRTDNFTIDYDPQDIAENKKLAVLSYIGPLILISIFLGRKSKFAMFHFCQALLNIIVFIVYYILFNFLCTSGFLPIVLTVIFFILLFPGLLAFPIFSILGIVHAAKGKAITMPLYGRIPLMKFMFKKL